MRFITLILALLFAVPVIAEDPTFHVTDVMRNCEFVWQGEQATGEVHNTYLRIEKKETLRNGMTGFVLLGYVCHTEVIPFRPNYGAVGGDFENPAARATEHFVYSTEKGERGQANTEIQAIENVTGVTEGYVLYIERSEEPKGQPCAFCEQVFYGRKTCPFCYIGRF
jgi:hypothetical protein